MLLRLAAFATLLMLLSGCSGSTASDSHPDDLADVPATDPAKVTVPAVVIPVPVTVVCKVERTQVGTSTGIGVFADRILLDDPGCYLDALFGEDAVAEAGAVLVEVQWSPGPTMTAADAWFEASDCQSIPTDPCPLPRATGTTGPLRLVLQDDDFRVHADADLGVQVAAQGLGFQQAFTVTLTLFAEDRVPEGYTALA